MAFYYKQRNVGKTYYINVTLHLIIKPTNFSRGVKNFSQHFSLSSVKSLSPGKKTTNNESVS